MKDTIESVLNGLIDTSIDGERGFAKAAEDAHDAELKSLLAACAQRCRQGATELQSLRYFEGAAPASKGSVGGALHRAWVSLREPLSARDDKAILEDCERCEDYAKAHYNKALEKDLPARVRAVVERQRQGVIDNHDRVRSWRQSIDRQQSRSRFAAEAQG